MALIFERAGYRVIQARSGQHALTLFERDGASIRIVVSDLLMPGMSGPDLVQRLLDRQPHLCVLFVSGYGWTFSSVLVQNRHVAFLEKPFRASELVAALERLITSALRSH